MTLQQQKDQTVLKPLFNKDCDIWHSSSTLERVGIKYSQSKNIIAEIVIYLEYVISQCTHYNFLFFLNILVFFF